MILKRNPSHAISDTTTSASPNHLPAASHRHTCFPPRFPPNRVALRVGLKPDATRFVTRLACPPCLLAIISLIAPSHRLISSAHLIGSSVPHVACLPRQTHAVVHRSVHPSHPSHRVHLPSRPASRSASRWASRLTYLPASFVSSISSISIRFAPSHWLIALPHRMRRATSRRNGAHDGQSTTVKRNATTSDNSPIPQTPLPARRIASTSRITHGHSQRTRPR